MIPIKEHTNRLEEVRKEFVTEIEALNKSNHAALRERDQFCSDVDRLNQACRREAVMLKRLYTSIALHYPNIQRDKRNYQDNEESSLTSGNCLFF